MFPGPFKPNLRFRRSSWNHDDLILCQYHSTCFVDFHASPSRLALDSSIAQILDAQILEAQILDDAQILDAYLGNVPRDSGTDELGELVVANLTPLRVVSNLIHKTFRYGRGAGSHVKGLQ